MFTKETIILSFSCHPFCRISLIVLAQGPRQTDTNKEHFDDVFPRLTAPIMTGTLATNQSLAGDHAMVIEKSLIELQLSAPHKNTNGALSAVLKSVARIVGHLCILLSA